VKVRLTAVAIADLGRALDYIHRESPGNAALVADRIDHAMRMLELFPYAGRQTNRAGVRQLAVPRTPYLLIYRVSADIEILSVLHGRQNR
jgi:plasmid stabilization system protein ParE